MDSEGKRQGLEQVRTRIEGLRNEIEDLTKIDKRERLTRQSGVPRDGRTQHEARIVRINEIKEELGQTGRREEVKPRHFPPPRLRPPDRQ